MVEYACTHPVLCMASAWFRQALTTADRPSNPSSPSAALASARLHTLFRASNAYKRTLKLWLKHHCRMTSSALPNCAVLKHTRDTLAEMKHDKIRLPFEQTDQEFTWSWSLGMMALKCTRTERKVQLLVFVFSWSCIEKSSQTVEIIQSNIRLLYVRYEWNLTLLKHVQKLSMWWG